MTKGQKKNTPLTERFETKVMPEPNTGCWLWIASTNEWGYGTMRVNRKTVLSHRVSFELFVDKIPSGKLVLHTCDVPCCVNPNHLYLGTDAQNNIDAQLRNRVKTKITKKQAIEIRELYKTKQFSQSKIAVDFNITQSNVASIVNRKTWKLC